MHRGTLWTEEGGSAARKNKTGLFFLHHSHLGLSLSMYAILECHIIIRYMHHKVEHWFAVLSKRDNHLRCLMTYMRALDIAERIIHIHNLLSLTLSHLQARRIVGKIKYYS